MARRLATIDGVVAVVLGGSRARGDADAQSDVDLAIYYDPARRPDPGELRSLAREVDDCHPDDVVTDFGGWGPWINGGAWLTVGGVRVDWLYRDLARVAEVIAECEAGRALVDPRDAFAALQARTRPYPSRLRDALVRQHLWDAGFALENAVQPAARGDTVFVAGCLHRCAACLLQVVFAVNRCYMLHEKRALQIAATLDHVPEGFAATLTDVLAAPGATASALERQIQRLDALVTSTRALSERPDRSIT